MSNVVVHSPSDPVTVTASRPPSFRRALLVAGLLLLFGGLIWMWVAFGARGFRDVDAQRADQRYKIYGDVIQSDQKTLNDPPSVLDKEKAKIRVPLADAMALTLREINANKPHAAYPVQPTNPAPNPAPPTANGAAPVPAPTAPAPAPAAGQKPAAPAAPAPSPSAGGQAPAAPSVPVPAPAGAATPPVPATGPAPNTFSDNNTVLTKQPDAPASGAPSGGSPSPSPSPAEGATNPR